jgi:hypothetical protein
MHGAKGDWKKTHREIMHAIKVSLGKLIKNYFAQIFTENQHFMQSCSLFLLTKA